MVGWTNGIVEDPTADDSTLIFIFNNVQNKSVPLDRDDFQQNYDDLSYSDYEEPEIPVDPVDPFDPVDDPFAAKKTVKFEKVSRLDKSSKVWTEEKEKENENQFFGPKFFPFKNFWPRNYEQPKRGHDFFSNFNPEQQQQQQQQQQQYQQQQQQQQQQYQQPPTPLTTTQTHLTRSTFRKTTSAIPPSYSSATTSTAQNITSSRFNQVKEQTYFPTVFTFTTTTSTTQPTPEVTSSFPIYVTKPPNAFPGFETNSVNPFLTGRKVGQDREESSDLKPDRKSDHVRDRKSYRVRFPPQKPFCPTTCRCRCDSNPK